MENHREWPQPNRPADLPTTYARLCACVRNMYVIIFLIAACCVTTRHKPAAAAHLQRLQPHRSTYGVLLARRRRRCRRGRWVDTVLTVVDLCPGRKNTTPTPTTHAAGRYSFFYFIFLSSSPRPVGNLDARIWRVFYARARCRQISIVVRVVTNARVQHVVFFHAFHRDFRQNIHFQRTRYWCRIFSHVWLNSMWCVHSSRYVRVLSNAWIQRGRGVTEYLFYFFIRSVPLLICIAFPYVIWHREHWFFIYFCVLLLISFNSSTGIVEYTHNAIFTFTRTVLTNNSKLCYLVRYRYRCSVVTKINDKNQNANYLCTLRSLPVVGLKKKIISRACIFFIIKAITSNIFALMWIYLTRIIILCTLVYFTFKLNLLRYHSSNLLTVILISFYFLYTPICLLSA